MAGRWLKWIGIAFGYAVLACAAYLGIMRLAVPEAMYEAHATIADTRLLVQGRAAIPARDADRRVADMIKLMTSEPVLKSAAERMRGLGVVTNPERVLRTLDVSQEQGTSLVHILVLCRDEIEAHAAASVLATESVRYYERLGQTARPGEVKASKSPDIRIIEITKTVPADRGLGARFLVFLGLVVFMPLGLATGHFLGRRIGWGPISAALLVCALGACIVLPALVKHAKTRCYSGYVTVTGRSAPRGDVERHLADLAWLARSRTIMERSVMVLQQQPVFPDPERVCSSLQATPDARSDSLVLQVRSPSEAEAKEAVEVIARQFVGYYDELTRPADQNGGRTPSDGGLVIAGPARATYGWGPMDWSWAKLLAIPIGTCMMGIVIGCCLGRRSVRKPRPVR